MRVYEIRLLDMNSFNFDMITVNIRTRLWWDYFVYE